MWAKEYNIYNSRLHGYLTRKYYYNIRRFNNNKKKTVCLPPARRIKDGVQIKRINFTVRHAYKLSVQFTFSRITSLSRAPYIIPTPSSNNIILLQRLYIVYKSHIPTCYVYRVITIF